jgi:hypothetical protein
MNICLSYTGIHKFKPWLYKKQIYFWSVLTFMTDVNLEAKKKGNL